MLPFMAGLYAANLLSIAIAVLVTAGTLAGEFALGMVQTLLVSPQCFGANL